MAVTMTTSFNIMMQSPRVSEIGNPVYYLCDNRRVPAKGFTFDDWSKEPFYWTGYLMMNKGPDYARVLHNAALDIDPEVNNRISDHLKSIAAAKAVAHAESVGVNFSTHQGANYES